MASGKETQFFDQEKGTLTFQNGDIYWRVLWRWSDLHQRARLQGMAFDTETVAKENKMGRV